jgi:hypothetical protein
MKQDGSLYLLLPIGLAEKLATTTAPSTAASIAAP